MISLLWVQITKGGTQRKINSSRLLFSLQAHAAVECRGLMRAVAPPEGKIVIGESRLIFSKPNEITGEVTLYLEIEKKELKLAAGRFTNNFRKIDFTFYENISWGDLKDFVSRCLHLQA